MKITKVDAFAIKAEPIDKRAYWGSRAWGTELSPGQVEPSTEYPVPLRRRFVYSRTIDTVIVRIETDSGHIGWGEAKAPVAPEATAQIIRLLLTDILMGADPREVLVLWERMFINDGKRDLICAVSQNGALWCVIINSMRGCS